jgi:hypothetical protein
MISDSERFIRDAGTAARDVHLEKSRDYLGQSRVDESQRRELLEHCDAALGSRDAADLFRDAEEARPEGSAGYNQAMSKLILAFLLLLSGGASLQAQEGSLPAGLPYRMSFQ